MRRSILVAVIVSVALVAGCAPAAPGSTPSPSPSAAASPGSGQGAIPLADRVEAEIEVLGSPDWPVAAFDSIWVLAPDLPLRAGAGSPNLVRIDPATNEVVATIPLPDRLCQGFTATDEAIWACSEDALVRIDPATNEIVDSVPVKSGQAFYRPAFGDGMVWALGSTAFVSDTVIRLDPATSETTPFEQPASVGGMVYAFEALWLTIPGEGTLVRLEPSTGETEVMADDLEAPTGIAAGADSLWVSLYGAEGGEAAAGDTQLVRIDPESGDIVADFGIGGSPKGGVEVWAGDDGVLVRSTAPWLTRIDPATNEVVETITSDAPVQGPLTVAYGSIWTIAIERDVVYRVKP